jgi:hypothetical protein
MLNGIPSSSPPVVHIAELTDCAFCSFQSLVATRNHAYVLVGTLAPSVLHVSDPSRVVAALILHVPHPVSYVKPNLPKLDLPERRYFLK